MLVYSTLGEMEFFFFVGYLTALSVSRKRKGVSRHRVVRERNITMGPAGLGTKNDCADEGHARDYSVGW
jgi:hypothetical protein